LLEGLYSSLARASTSKGKPTTNSNLQKRNWVGSKKRHWVGSKRRVCSLWCRSNVRIQVRVATAMRRKRLF
jgi:hypothetical protein